MSDFVFLNILTAASISNSVVKPEALILKSHQHNIKTLGIANENFFTAFELNNLAQKRSIELHHGYRFMNEDLEYVIYPKNESGYRAIISFINNIDSLEALLRSDDVITIISLFQPFFYRIFDGNQRTFGEKVYSNLALIKNLYLGIENNASTNKKYLDFAREFIISRSYQGVAFPKIQYLEKNDLLALDMIQAIINQEIISGAPLKEGPNFFLDETIIKERYLELEIRNTRAISDELNFNLHQKRGQLFKVSDDKEVLRKLAISNFKAIKLDPSKYEKRLFYELDIVISRGFASYFLIVADVINYAKANNILIGPARGSVGGSLLAYVLNITEIDPLKYDLLFERFLNPSRTDMPDIDIDIEDTKRDELINYVKSKYGSLHVGLIATLGTLLARNSIRDTGRIFAYPNHDIDRLAKTISSKDNDLKSAYRNNKVFKNLLDTDSYYLDIIKKASKIEGLIRQTGIHAAGVIINNEDLNQCVPLKQINDTYVIQYEMLDLERQGFTKIDFLGLKNLTVIHEMLDRINLNHQLQLNTSNIPETDQKTFDLINRLETVGLFQLESPGMKKTIAEIEVKEFLDLALIIAIFRPGPMQHISEFARLRKEPKRVSYPAPMLETILKPTNGFFIYQEQIMEAARIYAGFTLETADVFRKAISKKNSALMEEYRDAFINGAIKNGRSIGEARRVFSSIEAFASYGFNKSHAVAYARISYLTAYLKANYPFEFYEVFVKTISYSDPRFEDITKELRSLGFVFSKLSINHSKKELSFDFERKIIIPPLSSIKALTNEVSDKILKIRTTPFSDIYDFFRRIAPLNLAKDILMALINAGLFDEFELTRATLRVGLDRLISYSHMFYGISEDLLAFNIDKPILQPQTSNEIADLDLEAKAVGHLFTHNIKTILKKAQLELPTINDFLYHHQASFAAIIQGIRIIKTKNNTRMAFITLFDDEDTIEVVAFEEFLTNYHPEPLMLVECFARHEQRLGRDSIILSKIRTVL
ncbi:MAG: DNA polymerase III subunit alpha [Erysipelotrichaceae bacterium]|jgi:DNA polymerase-3 subunit alpha|nr:DNA polymerase III subunit alpha [Erysipelotrichaceae bacterium]